jgi:hypothetical protein
MTSSELDIEPTHTFVNLQITENKAKLPIVFNWDQACHALSDHTVYLILCICQSKMTASFCSGTDQAREFYLGYGNICGAV